MVLGLLLLAALMLAAPAGPWRLPGLFDRRARMRAGMACFLLFTGTDHLLNPWRYLPMMPDAVPFPRMVVLLTGLCEIAGALGLLYRPTRRAAGIWLAVFFVCVLPANIKAAAQGITIAGLEAPNWAYWLRIAIQPGFCWWALYAACVIRWPARPGRPRPAACCSPPPARAGAHAAAPLPRRSRLR
jgi:uncharacterized membrane protein